MQVAFKSYDHLFNVEFLKKPYFSGIINHRVSIFFLAGGYSSVVQWCSSIFKRLIITFFESNWDRIIWEIDFLPKIPLLCCLLPCSPATLAIKKYIAINVSAYVQVHRQQIPAGVDGKLTAGVTKWDGCSFASK